MTTVKLLYLSQLLLLLLWIDGCESQTDNSLRRNFYPFGADQGDTVINFSSNACEGPIEIPYKIFNYSTVYVSTKRHLPRILCNYVSVVVVVVVVVVV